MLDNPERLECGLHEEPEKKKKINNSKICRTSLRAVEANYVISADTLIESYMNFLRTSYKTEDFDIE